MKMNANDSLRNETIFIGKLIEEELHRQELTVTWLSRKIHCDRRNIYDIFARASIDTNLLYRISLALQKDFFALYSDVLQSIEREELNQRGAPSLSPQHATRDNA